MISAPAVATGETFVPLAAIFAFGNEQEVLLLVNDAILAQLVISSLKTSLKSGYSCGPTIAGVVGSILVG